jgi:WD40 repeat protein
MTKSYLLLFVASIFINSAIAQKQATVLQVPGINQFCTINEKGVSVLPSGRYVTPAGNLIRITNDPFGMAISPNGKKAITLHNGVFTVIDLASLNNTRVPGYGNKINSPLAHQPLINSPLSNDSISKNSLPGVLPEGSFIGVAFASDSKTIYLSGGDDGSVIVYDIEKFQRIDSISLNGKIGDTVFGDSFTSDLVLNEDNNELLILDRGNFRLVRYDLANKRITASIPAGRQPFGLALSADKKMAFVANVGMYSYPLVTGMTKQNYDSLMISHHPYGNNTKESIEGTEVEGKKIPGLGSPNSSEAMSVFSIELTTNKVVDKLSVDR